MSPEQKSLVQTTWTMVVPIADTAAGLFYDRLFAIDASTPAMFTSTNMAEQKKKLMQALAFVIGGLEKTEQLVPTIQSLGRNHVRYGVTDKHYDFGRLRPAVDAGAGPEGRLDARREGRLGRGLHSRRRCDEGRCKGRDEGQRLIAPACPQVLPRASRNETRRRRFSSHSTKRTQRKLSSSDSLLILRSSG